MVYYLLPSLTCMYQAFRIYNTWMGDHSKYFVLRAILDEIKRYDLFEVVKLSGRVLLQGLRELEVRVECNEYIVHRNLKYSPCTCTGQVSQYRTQFQGSWNILCSEF